MLSFEGNQIAESVVVTVAPEKTLKPVVNSLSKFVSGELAEMKKEIKSLEVSSKSFKKFLVPKIGWIHAKNVDTSSRISRFKRSAGNISITEISSIERLRKFIAEKKSEKYTAMIIEMDFWQDEKCTILDKTAGLFAKKIINQWSSNLKYEFVAPTAVLLSTNPIVNVKEDSEEKLTSQVNEDRAIVEISPTVSVVNVEERFINHVKETRRLEIEIYGKTKYSLPNDITPVSKAWWLVKGNADHLLEDLGTKLQKKLAESGVEEIEIRFISQVNEARRLEIEIYGKTKYSLPKDITPVSKAWWLGKGNADRLLERLRVVSSASLSKFEIIVSSLMTKREHELKECIGLLRNSLFAKPLAPSEEEYYPIKDFNIKEVLDVESDALSLIFMKKKNEFSERKKSTKWEWLYHGSKSKDSTYNIAKENFSLSFLGSYTGNRGFYGEGIYFSTRGYLPMLIGIIEGHFMIIAAKVMKGKSNIVKHLTKEEFMKGEPIKDDFDSNLSENSIEVVIRNQEQILPSFIISFSVEGLKNVGTFVRNTPQGAVEQPDIYCNDKRLRSFI
ncbi:MAG TPA: hypothetical protein VHM20_02580 [Gammaproteobacteria bacterium]|jgi:Zn-finger nucleic acid-binding protein|nr:hypothetical protein [Gammaproteobacteria bacterium]